MSQLPRSITIYGTGLIGGSLALALKTADASVRVFGVDRPDVLDRALEMKAVDPGNPGDSDLIVLAAPVGQILKLLDEINPGRALILDVGSTKRRICAKAESRNLPFVGGHPMSGSDRSGLEAARPDLFVGTRFFLCPIQSTPEGALAVVEQLAIAIGAIPTVIAAEQHDRLVARISHLPQLLSTTLAGHAGADSDVAGPGFRSMTRLAGSTFNVWHDIVESNSDFISEELESYFARLRSVDAAIKAGRLDEIRTAFERANRFCR